jgi:hypothetical protein
MGHLILQRDNFMWPGFSLLGESSLAITMDDTGVNFQRLDFLVLSGTTSVSIASTGTPGGVNMLPQLAETTNNLTTVTLSGSEDFALGFTTHQSNSSDGVVTDIAAAAASPTTVHSSLKLIDASAATGNLHIVAGATNTSGEGHFTLPPPCWNGIPARTAAMCSAAPKNLRRSSQSCRTGSALPMIPQSVSRGR